MCETLYPFWVTVAFTMGCICKTAHKLLVVLKEPVLEIFPLASWAFF